jgi:hypothetical protein
MTFKSLFTSFKNFAYFIFPVFVNLSSFFG